MWNLKTKTPKNQPDFNEFEYLMKPYQKSIIRKLLNTKEPINTNDMWEHVQEELGIDAISRASVIFFLQDLDKYGYTTSIEKTGKGGYHSLYTMSLTKDELQVLITKHLMITLADALIDLLN